MSKPKKLKNKTHFAVVPKRLAYFSSALVLLLGVVLPVFVPRHGNADLVENRSLKLSSSAKGDVSTDANGVAVPPGDGGNGAKARHTVKFTMKTPNADTGGIIIMYCDSPIFQATCITPTGMTAANLTAVSFGAAHTMNTTSNFTLDTTTTNADLNLITAINTNGVCNGAGTTRTNCVVMRRGATQTETGTPIAELVYGGGGADWIQNPIPAGNENYTFYARILVFEEPTYDTLVDYGGLAASTTQQVDILARVQEILRFSVGTTSTPKGSNAACTAYNDSGALTLGASGTDVLDPAQAYDDFSFFRINTNTVNGVVVSYSGETLVSGTNDIDEIGDPPTIGSPVGSSLPGTEQFGLAIDDSHADYEFVSLVEAANYATGEGTITAGGTALFAFDDISETAPITVASAPAGIICDTGVVRYLANISTSTPAGIYRTTITYIATGTY